MTVLRKDMKTLAPELPAHLRHATDAAIAALDAAKSPAEKAAAQRQGEATAEMLKAHLTQANVMEAIKKAHRRPHDIRKGFGQ